MQNKAVTPQLRPLLFSMSSPESSQHHRDWLGPALPGQLGCRAQGAQQDTAVPAHPSGHVGTWAGNPRLGCTPHPHPTHDALGHTHLCHWMSCRWFGTAGFPGTAELSCSGRSVFLGILGCLLECKAPSSPYFQCKHFEGNVAAQMAHVSPRWPGHHTLPWTVPENPWVIKFPQHSMMEWLSPQVCWWWHHHSPKNHTRFQGWSLLSCQNANRRKLYFQVFLRGNDIAVDICACIWFVVSTINKIGWDETALLSWRDCTRPCLFDLEM